MSKLHIKKGDTVYVNSGEDKGKTGKVLRVIVDKQRAVVEGVNIVSKSQKPSAQNPQVNLRVSDAVRMKTASSSAMQKNQERRLSNGQYSKS